MDPRPSERDPFIGRSIGPSYIAVRRIGAGGMGAVYEAKHRQTGARAAIKVLNKELASDPSLMERFRREAQITASFDNPHVVKVLEFDLLPDGVPYMVMEFLEGEDLEARLKRQKRLTPPEALELMRSMVRALAEAHAVGVIHRDIKPGNLFYAQEGINERIKLLDFGVSKASNLTGDGLTVFGQVLGTVWYMSPEQARGQEPTPASDVYSVAVVLYECLCGELPFVAGSMQEYLFIIQKEDPRSILDLAPELPLGLDGIFARALARDPRVRTSSVKFFAEEFEDTFAMGSEQTTVRQISDPRIPVAPPPKAAAPPPPAPRKSGTNIPKPPPAPTARPSSPNLKLPPAPPPPPAPARAAPPPPPAPARAAPPPPPAPMPKAGSDPRLRRPGPPGPMPAGGPKIATDPRLRAARPAVDPVEDLPTPDEEGSTQIARRVVTPSTPIEAVSPHAEPITLDEDPKGRPGPPVMDFDAPFTDPLVNAASTTLPPAGRRGTAPFESTPVPSTVLGLPAFDETVEPTHASPPRPPPAPAMEDVSDSTRVVPPPAPLAPAPTVAAVARPSRAPPLPAPELMMDDSTRVTANPRPSTDPEHNPPERPDTPAVPEFPATMMNMEPFSPDATAREVEPVAGPPEDEAAPTAYLMDAGVDSEPTAAPRNRRRQTANKPLPPPEVEPAEDYDHEVGPADQNELEAYESGPQPAVQGGGTGKVVVLGVALGLGLLALVAAGAWFMTHHH